MDILAVALSIGAFVLSIGAVVVSLTSYWQQNRTLKVSMKDTRGEIMKEVERNVPKIVRIAKQRGYTP